MRCWLCKSHQFAQSPMFCNKYIFVNGSLSFIRISTYLYSWFLNNMGLNSTSSPVHEFFQYVYWRSFWRFVTIWKNWPKNHVSYKYWKIKKKLCIIVGVQCIISLTYIICVNREFMFLVRLQVKSTLLVVTFLGSQKLYVDFQLHMGDSAPLTLTLLKGQLYNNTFTSGEFYEE